MNLFTYLKELELSVTEKQAALLQDFAKILIAKNEVLNLTRITDKKEVMVKHIIDALIVAKFITFKKGMKVLDVGTGGGVPGIPLAILFPEIDFLLADSVAKKIHAVDEFIQALNLRNVKTVVGRAEELAQDKIYREEFDVVLARAVAPFRILVELTYPFVHLNGKMVAYKGPEYLHEFMDAQNALRLLQAESPQVKRYYLPENQGERTLIIIPKKFQTPSKYPRRVGVPGKTPL
ncbi:16S rRNA (guanine(527)-N(7))-methyltransferase RsmG [Candidatus Peregrinibacteria bacterium CG_4_10_14_0_2_um_filter_43_11]|nr:MAG: 16S rRNA (guanine(527)-N(7))-methyltransferase RsmG [Candidatus Peregrinibacteria bacterium CG_4_10_14_0_2_um_filter_43_11]